MKIRRCRDCNEYKYIESDGLCRSCHTGVKDRSSEYNLTYDPTDILPFSKGANQLVLGMIGSGKTVGNKIEIADILRQRDDVEVYILDPLAGYEKFTKEYDGSVIKFDDGDSFNIFNYNGANNKGDLKSKMDQIYDLVMRCFDKNDFELSKTHKRLLKVVIAETYKQNGVLPETSSVQNPPDYRDMMNIISSLQSNPEPIMKKNASQRQKKQIKSTLSDIYSKAKSIDRSFNLSVKNKVNVKSNTITYFDIGNVSSDKSSIKAHSIFNEVWERSRNSGKKTVFYIDNAQYLLELDNPIPSIQHCFSTARSHDTSICLSTSKHQEFLRSNGTNGIIGSMYNIRIHKLTGDCDQIKKKFGLSDSQISQLKNAKSGSASNTSENLRRYGNKGFKKNKISVDNSLISDI